MVTAEKFRSLALQIPGTVESEHMGHPDFRISGKIFASLGYPDDDHGMVRVTSELQQSLMTEAPSVFAPCAGAWGTRGATSVRLASAKVDLVRAALQVAAKSVAQNKRKALPGTFAQPRISRRRAQPLIGVAMTKPTKSKTAKPDSDGEDQITAYSQAQPLELRTICDLFRKLITVTLPRASSKVWHGSPVWFIDENPVVGYTATAKGVSLLFWNGQAFDEPNLKPVGKYRAAQAVFRDSNEIDRTLVRRWLRKAKLDVFDSKTFFKKLREGT